MRSLNTVIEGFFDNIKAVPYVELIEAYRKSKGWRNNSVVLWTTLYVLVANNKISPEDICRVYGDFSARHDIKNSSVLHRNIVYATKCCSDYDLLPYHIGGIRLHDEDKHKPPFIRPIINSETGRKDYTKDFKALLDAVHIKYVEGTDARGREKSDVYRYIKIL